MMVTPASSAKATAAWLAINGIPIGFDEPGGAQTRHDCAKVKEGYNHVIERLPNAPHHLSLHIGNERIEPRNGVWYWTATGFAGLYRFVLINEASGERHEAWVEVMPTTISYQQYQVMIDELQQIIAHLIFETRPKAKLVMGFAEGAPQFSAGLVDYYKLKPLMALFEKSGQPCAPPHAPH